MKNDEIKELVAVSASKVQTNISDTLRHATFYDAAITLLGEIVLRLPDLESMEEHAKANFERIKAEFKGQLAEGRTYDSTDYPQAIDEPVESPAQTKTAKKTKK